MLLAIVGIVLFLAFRSVLATPSGEGVPGAPQWQHERTHAGP